MKPNREHATNNAQSYFVTSLTWERRPLFRHQRWAELFIQSLYHYRETPYCLHEFVLMPDHFHLLITPKTSLERAVQLLKGGFSHRAKTELHSNMEVWQRGFADHRIRDVADYTNHVEYIHSNPVRKHLCAAPQEYSYSSANNKFLLDAAPQGLKPSSKGVIGTAEAVPLQIKKAAGGNN